jgi:FtsP/CotA-like multicopper oxidase with cupredoxin domain
MKFNKQAKTSVVALAFSLALAGPGWAAQTFHLRAETLSKSLPGGTEVHMWGFGLDDAPATVPGPALTIDPTASEVVIYLTNHLTVPVSLVIPGQNGFVRDALHSNLSDSQGRLRAVSFVKETLPGQVGVYRWENVIPGTFLYHSGSHAALQVQMGLYGALKKDLATKEVYAGTFYNTEVLLLLSEIDVDVHEAVRTNGYGTVIKSMIHSVPEYFLVNGEPYHSTQAAMPAGASGQTTLFRLLNACYDTRLPVLNGNYLKAIAEDGQKYAFPREQLAIQLPALKTIDALWVPEAAGDVVLYDRRLNLANGATPDGGLYQKLSVSP